MASVDPVCPVLRMLSEDGVVHVRWVAYIHKVVGVSQF
jgi:hypothetical protein